MYREKDLAGVGALLILFFGDEYFSTCDEDMIEKIKFIEGEVHREISRQDSGGQ